MKEIMEFDLYITAANAILSYNVVAPMDMGQIIYTML